MYYLLMLLTTFCFAEDKAGDVKAYKERYWAQDDNAQIEVVQSRNYSKSKKLEIAAFGGFLSSDPFLDTKTLGTSLGYHLNETIGFHLVAWKNFSTPSTALTTFEKTMGATTNYNAPKLYYGFETSFSLIYGKISLIGKSILYYDFYTLANLGQTQTESGNYVTPGLGVGQRIHISKNLSIKFEYRIQRFNEVIKERVITPKLGQTVGERVNWSNSIQIGIGVLFDVK